MEKHKYLTLDAIRGVAAIFVMSIHIGAIFGGIQFPHAYLAVDLFFVMSGFVISTAYDKNLESGTLTATNFLKIRAARLYPLYILALIISIFGQLHNFTNHTSTFDWLDFTVAAIFGIFLLPSPLPGWGFVLFPLNSPSWSIFFEIIANAIYAKYRLYLTSSALKYVMLGSAVLLVIFVFVQHNMSFGFSWRNGIGGFARVIYSFSAGLMIYKIRINLKFNRQFNNIFSMFAISMVFMLLGLPIEQYTEFYDLIVVLFVFPILVLCATFVEPSRNGSLEKTYGFMGLTSYAIYILQVPIISAFPTIYEIPGYIAVAILFALSYVIDLYYDQPVRRWITRKFLNTKMVKSNF